MPDNSRQIRQRGEHYKYILIHPADGSFERVYPANITEKKQLICANRISMVPNNLEGVDASSVGELVFISDENGIFNGLEFNDVASRLAGFKLYGLVLIEDRINRFAFIP